MPLTPRSRGSGNSGVFLLEMLKHASIQQTQRYCAFINVFYTPLRSFVFEHLRTQLFFDREREIPADSKALYDQVARDLRAERRGRVNRGRSKETVAAVDQRRCEHVGDVRVPVHSDLRPAREEGG
jgi:hypothetical protein